MMQLQLFFLVLVGHLHMGVSVNVTTDRTHPFLNSHLMSIIMADTRRLELVKATTVFNGTGMSADWGSHILATAVNYLYAQKYNHTFSYYVCDAPISHNFWGLRSAQWCKILALWNALSVHANNSLVLYLDTDAVFNSINLSIPDALHPHHPLWDTASMHRACVILPSDTPFALPEPKHFHADGVGATTAVILAKPTPQARWLLRLVWNNANLSRFNNGFPQEQAVFTQGLLKNDDIRHEYISVINMVVHATPERPENNSYIRHVPHWTPEMRDGVFRTALSCFGVKTDQHFVEVLNQIRSHHTVLLDVKEMEHDLFSPFSFDLASGRFFLNSILANEQGR